MVAVLIALVVREQRQIADQRSALAGEMEAAQKMQRALNPASIDSLPGLKIDVAFSPAREVGGDFYSCRTLPAGHQRILLGDVSGKGAAAAMTAAVLLGAAERREKDSPAELLHHLNLVYSICALAASPLACAPTYPQMVPSPLPAPAISRPIAAARELKIESRLPLGVTAQAEYSETAFQLVPGDTLTFLTDGVVEARSSSGELFGFERTAAISTQSARIDRPGRPGLRPG